ncbi:TonB-dependent receptor [Pseudomonas sp. N040]|nr:TonB-dependent receptor [Pseudomonas sp. N040]MBW7014397.1 TonB-dependent receptor [Pseudomonas sp. N040]
MLAAALPAGLSLAEEPGPEAPPLVITGSRYQASSFNLPFAVQRVDAEQATAGKPRVNLSEALSSVPGLVVQNRSNYAQDLQISSRGFGARSAFGIRGIKLLADGVPLSNPDGQGQAATFDLDTLDHIEVLRGPFANVYGSNSGGVIQLFSRDGAGPPRVSASTAMAAWDTRRSQVSVEGGNQQAGVLVNQSHFSTDGYRQHSSASLDKTFAKLTLHPDAESRLALIYTQLNQNDSLDPQGLTWDEYTARQDAAAPGALLFDTRKTVDHSSLALNFDRDFSAGTWQNTLYGGTRHVTQYQSIPVVVQLNPKSSGGVIDFERSFQGASTRWIQPLNVFAGALTVTSGLEYDASSDDRQGYENFVGSTLGVQGALRRDEQDDVTSLSPFVQAAWELERLQLQSGLRYNHVEFTVDDTYITGSNGDDSGGVTYTDYTPNLGASYLLNPQLSVYTSWSRGFETPTLNELFYSGPDGRFGFDLAPATSEQYEVGLKARLGRSSNLQLALFQIDTEDELVVLSSIGGRTSYQNAAQTERHGVELALDSRLSETLTMRLAATAMSAIYSEAFVSRGNTIGAGRHIPNIPARSLFAELAWQPAAGFSTALEGIYRSNLYVEDSNAAKTAPSYSLFNWQARLEQQFEQLTLNQVLRIDNLLDRDYIGSIIVGDSNGRYYEPGPERAWYVGAGLEYRFE